MSTNILIGIILFSVIVILIIYSLLSKALKSKEDLITNLNNQNSLVTQELAQERNLLNESKERFYELSQEYRSLEMDFKHTREKLDRLLLDEEQKKEQFKYLATQILEEKTKSFDNAHRKGIQDLLDPLKERIKAFETKVDKSNESHLIRHTELHSQINQLKELNQQITKETVNLTNALKGDQKTQGNWGEIILESILQKSGLEKDREYFIQKNLKDEDGKNQRPDVIIQLPDQKNLIIDSKVSITAYERMVSTNEEDEILRASKALAISIKSHIDGLSAKNYHDLYKTSSPDFVLMFIPIDSVFTAALNIIPDLYTYAFDKNIVIVTPSTLLATLKTVDTMWRNEKQHKYAIEISTEAGKMYDKFALLVDDLLKLGSRLEQVKSTYDDSMKKLSDGKGNLISRAEKMKKLGAKANKQLPDHLI